MNKAMNSCERWKRPANSFAEECNESNEHLDVLKTLEKRNKAPGPDFRNTEHPCTSNYLGGAELKRHESWKTVAKDNENHTNVNICNNELFTASYTDKNHTKQAHNSRKKMEERNRAMDVVDETSSYFLNGHIPANNSDETRIYSDLMQSRVLGTSKEREQEQITVRPEYGSCGHFSTDPIQTTSSSSNTFQEAFGNCTEVMAPTKHKDSNLQAGRRTLCGISQHTSSTAATLLTGEDTPCRFCEHVPNLVNMPAQTVSSTLSAPRETFTQSSKVHTVRGNKAPSLQNDDAVMDRSCKQATSKRSASSEDELCCRICHSVTDLETLVSPCLCTGSMKYVHESCLLNWLKSSVKTNCELCLHEVPVKKLVKPFSEWRLLDEKPVAIIWLLSFLILLTLNILSVIKDASRSCTSTTCIVFYALGCTGAILGVIFLWFWAKKSAVYLKKLLTLNQIWLLEEKDYKSVDKASSFAINYNV